MIHLLLLLQTISITCAFKSLIYVDCTSRKDSEDFELLKSVFNAPDSEVQVKRQTTNCVHSFVWTFIEEKDGQTQPFPVEVPKQASKVSSDQVLRFGIHYLKAFKCENKKSIETCTTETEFAKSVKDLSEKELNDLEDQLFTKMEHNKRDIETFPSLVRQYIIVETLLAEIIESKTVRTEKEQIFWEWTIKAKKSFWGPSVWPVFVNGIRGSVASRRVKLDDILLRIHDLVIHPSMAAAFFNSTLEDFYPTKEWREFLVMNAFIAYNYEMGPKSEWWPYVDYLHEAVDSGIFDWSNDELRQLEDPEFFQRIESIKRSAKEFLMLKQQNLD